MIQFSLHPHALQFKRPARTSRGNLQERLVWFVRAWQTEQPKICGLGECGPVPGLSIDNPVELRIASVSAALSELKIDLQRSPALAFGVETALLDLCNGGRQRLFDTPFSRGDAGLTTHGLIWMDTLAGVLEQIERKVAQGFIVIKMKVGALPFADELALLNEVRRRHPTIELRLDANGAFSVEDALLKLDRLANVGVAFLEQPIGAGQWQALAQLCRQSPIPIGLDEELIGIHEPAQQRALIEAIRPQHLILKPTLLGGFAACEKWMRLADEVGATWWINSLLESNLGLNAICQWTSSVGGDRIHGLGTGQLFVENVQSPLRLKDAQMWIDRQADWVLPVY